MNKTKITDEQWKLFSLYLTRNNKSKAGRPQRIDDRIAFEGVIYVLKQAFHGGIYQRNLEHGKLFINSLPDGLNQEP